MNNNIINREIWNEINVGYQTFKTSFEFEKLLISISEEQNIFFVKILSSKTEYVKTVNEFKYLFEQKKANQISLLLNDENSDFLIDLKNHFKNTYNKNDEFAQTFIQIWLFISGEIVKNKQAKFNNESNLYELLIQYGDDSENNGIIQLENI